MQRYPDRFLFGTDAAAPADQSKYLKVFHQYEPLWKALDGRNIKESPFAELRTNLRWSARQSSKLGECFTCQVPVQIEHSAINLGGNSMKFLSLSMLSAIGIDFCNHGCRRRQIFRCGEWEFRHSQAGRRTRIACLRCWTRGRQCRGLNRS